jgi:hypothetical protein
MALQKCALCGNRAQLQKSHIIPKFVGEWLKKTSATGYLRAATMPNVRKQDLVTVELLCRSCEQRFGQWETQVANHIFRPFHKQRLHEPRSPQSFAYEEWLLRFAVSLAWRTVTIEVASFCQGSPALAPFVTKALTIWRNYMLHDHASPGLYEHHLLFLDVVESATVEVPDGLHAYMLRGVDGTIVSGGQVVYAFTKLPGMVFWTGIEPPTIDGWENTKIERAGIIGPNQRVDDGVFLEFFLDRAAMTSGMMAAMSDTQQDRIAESLRQNPDRVAKSQTIEAIRADERWRQGH